MKFFWTILCMALLVACQNGESTTGDTAKTTVKKGNNGQGSGAVKEILPVTEVDGEYELASAEIAGKNVKLRGEKKISFNFERGKLSGRCLCNSFSGSFSLGEGSSLNISEFANGSRICSGKMGKESDILSIIQSAGTYELLASTALKINAEKGNLVLRKIL